MSAAYGLSEDQFAKLASLLPNDARGVERQDGRRVTSGIVHALRSGGR